MNTEQLKTDDAFEDKYINPIVDSILLYHSRQPIKRLSDFASQESKRAVDEFKEKLKQELQYKAIQKLTSKTIRRKVYVFERLDLKEIVYLIDKTLNL